MEINAVTTIATGLTSLFTSIFNPSSPEAKDLYDVNVMWNNVPYVSDMKNYGQDNYWATPEETILKNGGTSEDIAIAKMFDLLGKGYAEKDLKLLKVIRSEAGTQDFVLLVNDKAGAFILDHTTNQLKKVNDPREPITEGIREVGYSINRYEFNPTNFSVMKTSSDDLKNWTAMLKRYKEQKGLKGSIFPGPSGMKLASYEQPKKF